MSTVIILALASIFLIAGLSKTSGSAAGLSGTREVGLGDGWARLVGIFEFLAALSLLIGYFLDDKNLILYGFWIIWIVMAGAVAFHGRSKKLRTGVPAMFLLTITTFGIVTL
jgi:uncharacterized membrane protein YphA (DoxX/SURF4 family)